GAERFLFTAGRRCRCRPGRRRRSRRGDLVCGDNRLGRRSFLLHSDINHRCVLAAGGNGDSVRSWWTNSKDIVGASALELGMDDYLNLSEKVALITGAHLANGAQLMR